MYVNRETLDEFWHAYLVDVDETLRFGQYFINMTGYCPNGDKIMQDKLWEENCPKKAYEIISRSLMETQS